MHLEIVMGLWKLIWKIIGIGELKNQADWVKELMRTRCFEAEDTEPEYK